MSARHRRTITIALAQLNPVVGDLDGNLERARAALGEAGEADLLVFSELFLCGYPPEDLVLRPAFAEAARAALSELARATAGGGPAILVGAPVAEGGKLRNSMALLAEGKIAGLGHKRHLPNYEVFDEKRIFAPGPLPEPFELGGFRFGAPVCEDIWTGEVCAHLKDRGAQMLIVANGSPFDMGKQAERLDHARRRTEETSLPLVYVNQTGGQDELVFDGASFALDSSGSAAAQAPAFESGVYRLRWERGPDESWRCVDGLRAPLPGGAGALYQAVMWGVRDYVGKNGFPGVVLGLSGGVDSALCAALAADALGADKVRCLMMPSRYSSAGSTQDAQTLARALGVSCEAAGIDPVTDAFSGVLAPLFAGRQADVTEENIQARTRGVLLMAHSNKFGGMVLTTGNKSEMAVGYATLYGDMNGGFNPLKDLYKMQVYELARWRNAHRPPGALGPSGPVIPAAILDKPPSAELRPGQKDEDSLPPYPVLDEILRLLIDEEKSLAAIAAQGFDAEDVRRIAGLVRRAEYKRRQAPPGVKVGPRAFGRARRYPITNAFREEA